MSQAPVPCGLTPKLLCSLADSVISEVGEQGRCTPHIPSCCPHLCFGGAALAQRWDRSPLPAAGPLSKPAFCLIGKAGKAINGSSPAFRKWIRASE